MVFMDKTLDSNDKNDLRILKNLVETFRNDEQRRFAFYNLSQIILARENNLLSLENEDYKEFLEGKIPFYSEKFWIINKEYYIDAGKEKGYRVKRRLFARDTFDIIEENCQTNF